jgi:hypothetical protein
LLTPRLKTHEDRGTARFRDVHTESDEDRLSDVYASERRARPTCRQIERVPREVQPALSKPYKFFLCCLHGLPRTLHFVFRVSGIKDVVHKISVPCCSFGTVRAHCRPSVRLGVVQQQASVSGSGSVLSALLIVRFLVSKEGLETAQALHMF